MSFGNTNKNGSGTSYWLLVDTEGRLQIVGTAPHGTAEAGSPLKIGGVYKVSPTNVDDGDMADLLTEINGRLQAQAFLWNGAGGDRAMNNSEVELIAAGTYAATQASGDQINYNARGVAVTFDITAVPGTDTVTIRLQMKDDVSGKYITLAEDSAQVATGTRLLIVYPGAGAAGGAINVSESYPLPRTWRVQVTHSGSGNFTYSVGGSYIL